MAGLTVHAGRIKKGSNECGIEDQVTFSGANAKWSQGSHGPRPGGCDAQHDQADCVAAGCEWLAGIHVCIDKDSAASRQTNPF